MRVLHLALLLWNFRGALTSDQKYTRRLQETIQRVISVSTAASAPVLMNLNCELDTSFLSNLVASHLSLDLLKKRFPRSAQWPKMSLYAKVLMTKHGEDGFYLGLYCHRKGWNHGPWHSVPEEAYGSTWPVRFPGRSYVFLWTTDSQNFWDEPLNRFATYFTRIYATWDNRTSELTLRTRGSDLRKRYSSYLQLHVNFEQSLETLEWESLRFGRNSIRHLKILKVRLEEPAGPMGYPRNFVELGDPREPNITFILELADLRFSAFSDPWESAWLSSYHATVPVARVPPISKNKQVARKILCLEMWLPLICIASAATVVLKYATNSSETCFFYLVLSLVHPVNIDHRAKSRQFFLIVGTWILFVQVIKLLFQGDFVASMHGLPEGRRRSITRCEHPDLFMRPKDTHGYVLSGGLTAFLRYELAALLQGTVICRNFDGFGPLQESLLSNIPMYKLDAGPETIARTRILLMSAHMLNASDHSRSRSFATTYLDYPNLCCIRLAQSGLTNFLFRPIYRKQLSHNSHESLTEKLSDIMKSDLSPSYGTEHCQSLGAGLRFYRCFTMDDLHPPSGIVTRLVDLESSLLIGAALILASTALFMLELRRGSLRWCRM